MFIIHCVKESEWDLYSNSKYYGMESVAKDGFVHCCDIGTYNTIVDGFKDINENLVLLVIDTDKVEAEIKWEDLYNCNINHPHIYGCLNTNAVIDVLPHLWSENKEWIMNEELKQYI